MIQRIQSVFLVSAVVLNLIIPATPIFKRALEDPKLWIGIGLIAGLGISVLLTLYGIALFKNRAKQMVWVKRAMIFQIIGVAFALGILFSMGGIGRYLWDEALSSLAIILALVFQFLALRAIQKDEKLVQSMDRIR